jgi:hypothetical protein
MPVRTELIDRTPKFLAFYRLAQGADPETRWTLWQEHYNLAMVPPGPDGQAMARRMLDACWDRYPDVMDRIEAGAAGLQPAPQAVMDRVAGLFACDRDLTVRVIVITANLEGNAYAYGRDGIQHVVIPVEQTPEYLGPVMAHEFTHAVHMALSGCSEGYPTSIALRALMEGLAITGAMAAHPGLPETAYLESPEEPGWVARCREHEGPILRAVLEHLPVCEIATYHRFILGPGPGAGLTREVYWGGYRAVQHLLGEGRTLAELARIPEADMVPLLRQALTALLA